VLRVSVVRARICQLDLHSSTKSLVTVFVYQTHFQKLQICAVGECPTAWVSFQLHFKLQYLVHTCHRRSVVGSVAAYASRSARSQDIRHRPYSIGWNKFVIRITAAGTATSQEIRLSEDANAFSSSDTIQNTQHQSEQRYNFRIQIVASSAQVQDLSHRILSWSAAKLGNSWSSRHHRSRSSSCSIHRVCDLFANAEHKSTGNPNKNFSNKLNLG